MTWNMVSMFHEKGLRTEPWSMTRVVAFMLAVVLSLGIVIMAFHDKLGEVGFPFAAIVCTVVMAVPFKELFRALVEWLKSKPGAAFIERLITKAVGAPSPTITDAAESIPGAITTTTTVTPATVSPAEAVGE